MSGASSIGSTGGITRGRFGSGLGSRNEYTVESRAPSTGKDFLLVVGVGVVLVLLHDAGLTRLFLHLVEFLPGGIKRFLLAIDIALVLRVVFIKLGGVAQAGARIALISGRTQTKFALLEVGLMVQGIDLLFLLVELFCPLVCCLLAFGSGRSGVAGVALF